ncbi:ABSCISIC ACID RECEPTOR PYL9-LIKE [Salix viminalis]|uniref:ABSCISIC ACID RECEPTOR PYL9-LIKE n=1 Tax=Salix viminalis TaxID=40686 RepID=A0A9Q0TMJ8_SALVM|nr:ABSCISIC ACID RECEPTOR PYL9-LIKE [Salix viminalis]
MVTNDYVTIANGKMEDEFIKRHHKHDVKEHQCSSSLVKHIKAHVPAVWSLVRRFDQPQEYKPFVSRCIVQGDVQIGSVREVNVKSGLPATTSTERLELLDDDKHIFGMKIVGGDHRLKNYSSIVTVHPEVIDGRPGTLVIESFVVDVPDGNTEDETCNFVEALIKCNLKSLADVSERLAVQVWAESIDRIPFSGSLVCASGITLMGESPPNLVSVVDLFMLGMTIDCPKKPESRMTSSHFVLILSASAKTLRFQAVN